MKCFRLPFSVGLPRAQCTLENPRTVTAINPAIMHPPASWPAADLTPRLRDVRGRPTTYAKRRSRGGGARCQSAARRCDYGFCMRHFRYSFKQRGSRAAAASPACRPMTAACIGYPCAQRVFRTSEYRATSRWPRCTSMASRSPWACCVTAKAPWHRVGRHQSENAL